MITLWANWYACWRFFSDWWWTGDSREPKGDGETDIVRFNIICHSNTQHFSKLTIKCTGLFRAIEDERSRMLERAFDNFIVPLEIFRKDQVSRKCPVSACDHHTIAQIGNVLLPYNCSDWSGQREKEEVWQADLQVLRQSGEVANIFLNKIIQWEILVICELYLPSCHEWHEPFSQELDNIYCVSGTWASQQRKQGLCFKRYGGCLMAIIHQQ